MFGFLTTIFAFLLCLGPLVVIHELGHYLVGRLFGVKADAFSVGFGKELAGWTDKRGTRWKLSALPLGGYVQFAGDMNPASAPGAGQDGLTREERARTFHVKPLWQRALIVLAGPVTNLLLCVAILAGFTYAYGDLVAEPKISDFTQDSISRDAGLREGDRITAIDGESIRDVEDVYNATALVPGRTLPVTVDRGGDRLTLPVKVGTRDIDDGLGQTQAVGDLGLAFDQPVVAGFAPDSPAKAAGFEVGDRIVRVDDTDVTSFQDVVDVVQPQPGQTLTFTVMRDGVARVIPVEVTSAERTDEKGRSSKVGIIGVQGRTGELVSVGPLEALAIGTDRSLDIMKMMVQGLRQIVFGERSVKDLGGPIKIARVSGQALSLGWQEFVGFAAMISINLAFINLLPIPGLDGGHLAFYAAEWIRSKPLGVRSQEWAIRTGVVFLLSLMLFVTVNDIVSLPIFGS